MLKFTPLQLTLFIILGILTGFYLHPTPKIVTIYLLVLFIVLIVFSAYSKKTIKPRYYFTTATFFIFFFVGIASITFHNDLNKKNHYTSFIEKKDLSNDSKMILHIDKILKSTNFHNKYIVKVVKVDGRNTQGKILLNVKKDSTTNYLNVDDKLFIKMNFQTINKPKNPYQFNYSKYLEKQNVYRQITISNNDYLKLKNDYVSLNGLAHRFRVTVNKSLKKYSFKDDELAIINALLLGQRQEISKELIDNYSKAGAIHILAVSGLHVGIILLLITIILKPLERLKNGRNIQLIITILLLWIFAFIAGMSASVVRAVTMFTAISIGLFVGRKNSIYRNLIISIFFLLLFNPYYLFEVGFQLSYLAVFFIVWLQPIIYKIWKPKFKLLDYFWKLFTVSTAAQIGVLPLSLYYFHQFPGLFFIANLAIIPVLGIILGVGIVIIFTALFNFLPQIIATFYQEIIGLMNDLIAWIAKQESFLFESIHFSLVIMITTYLFIIFSFRWIESKTINRFKYVLFSVILIQLVFVFEQFKSLSKKEFIIFTKSRNSIVGLRTNNELSLYHNLDSLKTNNNTVKPYIIASNIKKISIIDSLNNNYLIKDNKLLVIDSLSIYKFEKYKPNYILLTQSPKINLERLIQKTNPKIIIADASNYKSYVNRWQKTCLQNNIKFYYTVNDGAFIERY